MQTYIKHLAHFQSSVTDALKKLDILGFKATLFIVDDKNKLIGSLTDGDIRRGFISGFSLLDSVLEFANRDPQHLRQGAYKVAELIALRKEFSIIPIVNAENQIVDIVDFTLQKSYLPVDALIMAGGRGERLKPLTDTIPKPLLKIGEKPIIEHNLLRLKTYGITHTRISVRYLGQQLVDYFQDGKERNLRIEYLWEENPMGTAGSLALIDEFNHDYILMMNSDLLTNIDYEDLYLFFEEEDADFVVGCIPYNVTVPYAVMDIENKAVMSLKEKPSYTYYSNAGIYLMKREVIDLIPKGVEFNATDLMEQLILLGKKIISYPILDYWLDIGNHHDFEKAQKDILNLKLY
jgi:dTDP-glucose pyrophosphorylase